MTLYKGLRRPQREHVFSGIILCKIKLCGGQVQRGKQAREFTVFCPKMMYHVRTQTIHIATYRFFRKCIVKVILSSISMDMH